MPSHEPLEKLTPKTLDYVRASRSLREELEAVELYQERIDATEDSELKEILAHNRDEEKEHAAMLIEYLRRQDQVLEHELKDYLFKDGQISHD
ncbi:MAG: ferritin [Candidatus Komeilibacteria bacterium CG10_big_fil_rev_8_21_14_0_10_41_13]|uniref:Ferritin n=1 Tax=Candidatus Komeilibacteria bacterium CG10_big_fil_rev_8_21_14_0_10_41_13 TaxID=1974476 RepID=A0A2M6WCZ0_9BACT|nr:MAG: ferritin [Candidatus Komeilibacteria bacterium CG10_big_fil_rev_8_21_14_0_10_41_13]